MICSICGKKQFQTHLEQLNHDIHEVMSFLPANTANWSI